VIDVGEHFDRWRDIGASSVQASKGGSFSVAGGNAIRAQQVKVAPGYVVAELEVNDPTTFQKYGAAIPGTLAPFDGKFLVRAGKVTPLEGDAPKGRFVVIAFDSVEKAVAWDSSPAYEAIKPLRQSSAKTRSFIVEGVTPQ